MPRAMSRPSEPVETTWMSSDHLALAEPHDRALAELLFDLGECGLQGLGFFGVQGGGAVLMVGSLLTGGWDSEQSTHRLAG